MPIKTKEEFMRTFLNPREKRLYDKGDKFWETVAVNRHLIYNRKNAIPFKIRVTSNVKKMLPKSNLRGKGTDLRPVRYKGRKVKR